MKIVVLDGYTLNSGDLDWGTLESLGDCRIYARTTPQEVVERTRNAELILTNKVVLDQAVLGQLPQLRYIGVLATGYNVVDTEEARRRGIVVTNIPSYGTESVAQHCFALLLELVNRVGLHAESVRAGEWSRSADFCYRLSPLYELAGRTFGVVGYGTIGRAAGRIARAFEMRVFAANSRNESGTAEDGTPLMPLEELLKCSDVISLHCPLTADNTGLINRERLALMKTGAFLLNTARGPLIDARALAEALHENRIAGAGLDVLEKEPPQPGNPLLAAPNCLITPHIAWATLEARRRLLAIAIANIKAFLAGTPQNQVNS